ncbi:hypothetical protein FFLO_03618 [Filobasidium floriforme]|uniref:Mitochondrial intermembrane space import and assembly protein 40 n=1 Tax=Filobasidium floriforme TaxID=5210 RepID=A0A8K0JKI7_9TREE|nr:hypothetical protein FFLO_03618 [Filobasidium floriforme]
MFTRTFRPLTRTLPALAATAGLATVGYSSIVSERNRVFNDVTGSGNFDSGKQQYNEDLKVNRHKIAAQHGATPESPLHNTSTSSTSHHVGTSKVDAEGHNVRRGDGTQASEVPGLVKDKAKEAKKEEQAGGESAYNEETGEINWDCPCLGGMAQGPCGEDFKAAFSCFVHSDQEPKGVDCVEKFKAMQDCFRKHPDVYGEEIEDEEPLGQPTSTDGPGPLSGGTVSGSPLPKDHPDQKNVPKPPTDDHPNTPQRTDTHLNNPAKGVAKLQPRENRADKKGKGAGDGSI